MQIMHTTRPMAAPTQTNGTAAGAPLMSDSVVDQSALVPAPSSDDSVPRPGRQVATLTDSAVANVLRSDSSARVSIDPASNTATFVSGEFGVVTKPGVGGSGPDSLARTFLIQHGNVFGVSDQNSQLKLMTAEKDELGFKHFRYQQMQDGLPVFGQQLVVHANGENVTSVGGRITPNIPSASPKLAGEEAARRAMQSTRSALASDGATDTKLQAVGSQNLGWYTLEDGTPKLAYEVVVGAHDDQRWQMYVDAQSGDVLDKWSLVHSAMKRETVDALTGKVRAEGAGPTGDAPLDAAHDYAKDVYDFFSEKFGRDSIDGRGMKLKSVVHYGHKYNNAFWNGSHMTYGDGDGVRFIPFSLGSDVVAHEMTHGVTERSAGLRYQRQSGALNESWSDVFGNLIEKWGEQRAGKPESDPKWRIGEAIFTPGVEGDGLRSMSEPGKGYDKDPQPGHMRDYKDTTADNGGVHINSGIPNKAAYEVAMTLGTDKLASVWYRALTSYLTPSSQFTDAANLTVQSAIDLYGKGSAEAKAVATAWSNVGLTPSLSPGAAA